jgi:predicted DNA-binding protein (MmcQ/YjbR family)
MNTSQELIAFCLTLPTAYEDYPFDGKLCVNLKCDPAEADFLRQIYEDVTHRLAYEQNALEHSHARRRCTGR